MSPQKRTLLERIFIQILIGRVSVDDIYIWVRGALSFKIKILGLSIDSEPFKHNQYLLELPLLVVYILNLSIML
ncbi:hypothetical protein Gogos_012641 [Gossypium gossypioides]|uniref:Uncharacterized protein n=1 Tax=Gossypium gossypioides TaxID=34282 RepID=A0A7J9BT48_GOSGO|nr:hypothetical protein [Gossypium gossypioides]